MGLCFIIQSASRFFGLLLYFKILLRCFLLLLWIICNFRLRLSLFILLIRLISSCIFLVFWFCDWGFFFFFGWSIFLNSHLFFFSPFFSQLHALEARNLVNVIADSQNKGVLLFLRIPFFDFVLGNLIR